MKTKSWLLPFAIAIGISFAGCSCEDPIDPGPGNGADAGADAGDGGDTDAGRDPDTGCAALGEACGSTTAACCQGACTTDGVCALLNANCSEAGESCQNNNDCCLNRCEGGSCSDQRCVDNGASCGSNGECCTGNCSSGTCAAIPGSTTQCGVVGQACGTGGDCCSTNCQGGFCTAAYFCRATDDLCYGDDDCCSRICSKNDGSAGVCIAPSGGCIQDGLPCQSGTNCCTRVCADPGSGATVCLPASGCRMTGNSCIDAQSCCGGGTNPNGSVQCEKSVATATYGRCDNGQSCNPVGNICGATFPLVDGGTFSVNASQNCCDGQKAVCKLDSAGIPRCYGGGSTECPNGYTGDAPCCIPAGDVCQFKDQCCNEAPCVADPQGILRCTVSNCVPLGNACTPGTDDCCVGDCLSSGEFGNFCQLPGSGSDGGTNTDGGTACKPNGQMCASGADCCSEICENGVCGEPQVCSPEGEVCSSTADCCSGTACVIASGSTSGTCQASTCAGPGQTCSAASPCCAGTDCLNSTQSALCDGTTACACVVRIE